MKTENDVRLRIRGLLTQELDRRVTEATKRLPHLCMHNHRQPLDNRKIVNGAPNKNFNRVANGKSLPVMGLCMLGQDDPTTWSGNICEDPPDAQGCPYFTSVLDKDIVLHMFYKDVSAPGWVEENMPELAGLFWALDQSPEVQLPWWKRLWCWVLQIRVEPLALPAPLEEEDLATLMDSPSQPPKLPQ